MHKIILACAFSASVLLAACGGGGGGDSSPASNAAASNGAVSGAATGSSGSSSNSTNTGNSGGTGNAGGATGNTSGNNSGTSSPNSGGGTAANGSGSGSASSGSGGSSSDSGSGTAGSGTSGSGTSGSGTSGSGSDAGGSGTSGNGGAADIGNTIPVRVSAASAVRNFPLVSVTICRPGSGGAASCATIDNVLLDTGSFGLRLFASTIPAATLAALPLQTDATSGRNVAACGAFGSGYTWGSLRSADVKMSAEVAPSVPIQVIGDTAIGSAAPASCIWNTALSSAAVLGANGILGVGVARYDCGAACARSTPATGYYYADAAVATPISMPLARQITNPVALFPVDNNGVIVDMPTVSANGAPTASGTLTFGIGTQSNNTLASAGATVMATDRWGNFTGSLGGASAIQSFVDSGSNALNFEDYAIVQDGGFYVPSSPVNRTVAFTDARGTSATADLAIGNANALFATYNFAFSNLGAFLAQTVDLGMPFFYGKRVYYGIDASAAGGTAAPYVAWLTS
ncbi:DUF3443 family protein [Paraburkholderia bannensis]|uniref:DUF3443 family protein n=1 Tax=Paraburkholderia bannensis TaxID=765414 RepID=UPI000ABEBB71|nr:DUF3443 family protein [Paraburkholderia bannensis]